MRYTTLTLTYILTVEFLYASVIYRGTEPPPPNSSLTGSPMRPTKPGSPNTWTGRRIPYYFKNDVTSDVRRNISAAMDTIEQESCLEFVQALKKEPDVIEFASNEEGALGRQGGQQVVNIGKGCGEVGVILHELMHALGFMHEHERSDRDLYITINQTNILDGCKGNFYKNPSPVLHSIPYDYDSIMHYRYDEFTCCRGRATIEPIKAGVDPARLGQRSHLSTNDTSRIKWLYSCQTKSTCPKLTLNGRVISNGRNKIGDTTRVVCKPTQVLIGPKTRMCKANGQWTGPPPYCQTKATIQARQDYRKYLHYCGFDEYCARLWQVDTTKGANWTLHSGKTSTLGTGPYFDNSFESSTGKYMYLEATNLNAGAVARVTSPNILDHQNGSCLMFFYHMYGDGIGALNVYVETRNPDPIFQRIGHQGFDWTMVLLTIPPPHPYSTAPSSFRVAFEAVRGESPFSDIAIDDVLIGPCPVLQSYRTLVADDEDKKSDSIVVPHKV